MDESQAYEGKLKSKRGAPPKKSSIPELDDDSSKRVIEEKEIKSITDFVDTISDLQERGFTFYRGDKNSKNYKLIPSIYRDDNGVLSNFESSMIDEFTSLSSNKQPYNTNKYIEEMLMAQHYELPTRLQDWSESALTALYFAVHIKNEDDREEDSILWALNPVDLNSNIDFIEPKKPVPNLISSSIDKKYEEKIEEYYMKNDNSNLDIFPIALNARKINPRIEAQRGVFVLFPKFDPSKCKCLTEYQNSEKFLYKLIISRDTSKQLLKNLKDIGISQYSLFPELKSIALDVRERHLKKVK